jgi:hypothetical protein
VKKIPTVFERNPEDRKHVLPTVTPSCEWVLAGEGVPTQKWDGTCVLVRHGRLYARREVKPGKQAPIGFELVQHDGTTGKSVGWVPAPQGDPEYTRHREAWSNSTEGGSDDLPDGTYELIGPKVNGNPEGLEMHVLVAHGDDLLSDVPLDFEGLGLYLRQHAPMEGIVWHHPDGRMAKLKRRDYPTSATAHPPA